MLPENSAIVRTSVIEFRQTQLKILLHIYKRERLKLSQYVNEMEIELLSGKL